jgi:hypothetical protein
MSDFDADILTVSFHNGAHIRSNARLMRVLNPDFSYRYLVVHNGGELEQLDDKWVTIEGAPRSPDESKGDGSYHHAAGLHKGLLEVKSRFLIVQDPDFFVVQPNWMKNLFAHMIENELSFFGSLWSPVKPRKYRYFPSVHFMVIDLQRVDIQTLDFEPDIKAGHFQKVFVEKLPLPMTWRRVLLLGHSRDTGFKIYRKYGADTKHRCEFLTSLVREDDFLKLASINPYPDWLLQYVPERWTVYPNKKCYRFDGFLDPALTANKGGWEEFSWEEKLFAVHLRNVGRKEYAQQSEDMTNLLKTFEQTVGPAWQ